MAATSSGIKGSGTASHYEGKPHCILKIRNRAGSRLNLVLHGTEVHIVRAMTIRRSKRLKLPKGTYVVEAWLSDGRIGIDSFNIPHISIEKITSRKDVSIRGRKIVADFVNDHARLEINREPTAGDIVQKI
jgi:hypothetical protein